MEQLFSRQGQPLRQITVDAKGKPLHVCDRKCWRCGGAGGSEKWRHTGWTCYRCGGNGTDPVRDRIKLYTADQLVKLNERKAKADAKKDAARRQREVEEQARRDQEKAEMISSHQDLIDRIAAELEHGAHEILESVIDRITVQVKEPTERQMEVVERVIRDRSAERARRAAAAHVGELGERREFTLTLLYHKAEQIGQFPTIMSYWSLFTDENGRKIASKSTPKSLGLVREKTDKWGVVGDVVKGQTIRVKAKVVEHKTDKSGEPITYINRPKGI